MNFYLTQYEPDDECEIPVYGWSKREYYLSNFSFKRNYVFYKLPKKYSANSGRSRSLKQDDVFLLYNKYNDKFIFYVEGSQLNIPTENKKEILKSLYCKIIKTAIVHGAKVIAVPLLEIDEQDPSTDDCIFAREVILNNFIDMSDIEIFLVTYALYPYVMNNKSLFNDLDKYLKPFLRIVKMKLGDSSDKRNSPAKRKRKTELWDFPWKKELSARIAESNKAFKEVLFEMIDERGLKDSDVYKGANMDRRLFAKIRNSENYVPRKNNIFALAISLKLSIVDTKRLLAAGGYDFSDSKMDIILAYFIDKGHYNIYDINEALDYYHEELMGSSFRED